MDLLARLEEPGRLPVALGVHFDEIENAAVGRGGRRGRRIVIIRRHQIRVVGRDPNRLGVALGILHRQVENAGGRTQRPTFPTNPTGKSCFHSEKNYVVNTI